MFRNAIGRKQVRRRSHDIAHTRYYLPQTSRALLSPTPEFALSRLFPPYSVSKHEHNLLNI